MAHRLGGTARLPIVDLRATLATEIGSISVSTYIVSGNLRATPRDALSAFPRARERAIDTQFS